MTRFVRLLALGLAVLWLPMTMHCQLASLKICCAVGSCCDHGCCGEESPACNDAACCAGAPVSHSSECKIVESGNYFLTKAPPVVPVASGAVTSVSVMLDRRGGTPRVVTLNEATGAPPGWSREWQFVFRAASAPRAPSAVG